MFSMLRRKSSFLASPKKSALPVAEGNSSGAYIRPSVVRIPDPRRPAGHVTMGKAGSCVAVLEPQHTISATRVSMPFKRAVVLL